MPEWGGRQVKSDCYIISRLLVQNLEHDIQKMVRMIDLNVTALAVLSSLFVRDYKYKQTQLINVSSVGGYFLFRFFALNSSENNLPSFNSKILFYARYVFARTSIDFDYFTDLNEKRYFYYCTSA